MISQFAVAISFCEYCQKQLPHRKRNDGKITNSFCSPQCYYHLQCDLFIVRWLAGLEKGTRGKTQTSHIIRRWVIKTRGEKCQQCGWAERHPQTGHVPIELHHIDGVWDNNRPENLQLLCPNCHALTSTFRNLNCVSGRGRKIILK